MCTRTSWVEVLDNSAYFLCDPDDPALRRIAVHGIKANDPAAKITVIGNWLRANLREILVGNV